MPQKARKTHKRAPQGKSHAFHGFFGLIFSVGLICNAPKRSTQHEKKMRTDVPGFWHCKSTEGKNQSQHENSVAEIETFSTLFPGDKHYHLANILFLSTLHFLSQWKGN